MHASSTAPSDRPFSLVGVEEASPLWARAVALRRSMPALSQRNESNESDDNDEGNES